MRLRAAAGGSALFFALAPGTVAGLVPWALTGWHTGAALPWPVRAAGAAMVGFVKGYEEPHLSQTYGADYDAYRRRVPGWWPRGGGTRRG